MLDAERIREHRTRNFVPIHRRKVTTCCSINRRRPSRAHPTSELATWERISAANAADSSIRIPDESKNNKKGCHEPTATAVGGKSDDGEPFSLAQYLIGTRHGGLRGLSYGGLPRQEVVVCKTSMTTPVYKIHSADSSMDADQRHATCMPW